MPSPGEGCIHFTSCQLADTDQCTPEKCGLYTVEADLTKTDSRVIALLFMVALAGLFLHICSSIN